MGTLDVPFLVENIMKNQIYLAGDMLNRGAQLQRAEEKRDLLNLGYELYVPQDNKDINDKENLNSNDGLAEKIVRADTDGIVNSDIVVMEAREAALGTCIELGQIKGMKDIAKTVRFMLAAGASMEEVDAYMQEIENKLVLVHNSDIRRAGNPTETGDRRSYAPHQYMYGVVLDVTNGHGFYDWNEITYILDKDNA
ncbi:nucleoside 2-deoxyribosyltransferase [Vibrio phage Cody]|uniref:Uncharacterized protein n=2 Tax=Thalassavirus TaxID=2948922 RepID=A0A6M9Z350_9CAUD|nr:nucleoside 2-deoxyribosyltransferase [Vibrio phage Cody]QKN85154.1 hypothetical protein CODY_124 [Vibrio phage Cody]QKN85546.1 hypothetical protein DIREPILLOW8_124 [Vibrio phage Direpillow8]WBU76531.1 hypothetical protein CHLORIS_118 [Vibrio phage Chloris]